MVRKNQNSPKGRSLSLRTHLRQSLRSGGGAAALIAQSKGGTVSFRFPDWSYPRQFRRIRRMPGAQAARTGKRAQVSMNREYHKWWSPRLNREMELLVFGHGGMPMLVFPSSMGRFFEYEDAGMIGAIWERFEQGHLQAFCVDSVDGESWYNKQAHPADRVRRHVAYESYVMYEVLPLIRAKNGSGDLAVTGCSFGGYHALNFTLRHPDLVTHCISMSGAYDIHSFLDGYYDDECYFNCPVDYLPQLNDEWFLGQYRQRVKFLLAAGEWDICLGANYDMAHWMGAKGIPHKLDVWGEQATHDWPLWKRMAQAYFM